VEREFPAQAQTAVVVWRPVSTTRGRGARLPGPEKAQEAVLDGPASSAWSPFAAGRSQRTPTFFWIFFFCSKIIKNVKNMEIGCHTMGSGGQVPKMTEYDA
jgi:hypothetical protein